MWCVAWVRIERDQRTFSFITLTIVTGFISLTYKSFIHLLPFTIIIVIITQHAKRLHPLQVRQPHIHINITIFSSPALKFTLLSYFSQPHPSIYTNSSYQKTRYNSGTPPPQTPLNTPQSRTNQPRLPESKKRLASRVIPIHPVTTGRRVLWGMVAILPRKIEGLDRAGRVNSRSSITTIRRTGALLDGTVQVVGLE